MTTAQAIIFLGLGIISAFLTVGMVATRERMLGFPSAIFFALLGGYSYTLSASAWDIFGIIGFACLLGMVTFTIYSSFALREKRDAIADKELEDGEGGYIDEGKEDEPGVSKQTKRVRARADKRRNR